MIFGNAANQLGIDSHSNGAGRHVLGHHRVCPNPAIIADHNISNQLGPGTQDDSVANGGVALDRIQRLSTQGHPVVDQHVIANHGGFSDDHPNSVINYQPAANIGTGVDFNS